MNETNLVAANITNQSAVLINTKLIGSIAQIILSLTEEERQLLAQTLQQQTVSVELQTRQKALQQNIQRSFPIKPYVSSIARFLLT